MKKRIVILVLVLGLFAPGVRAATSQDVQTVIVTPVQAPARAGFTGGSRAEIEVNLKDEARRSQSALVAELETLSRGKGERSVQEFHPLWLVNRVIVTASREGVARIAARLDVASVRPARVIQLVQTADVAADARPAEYGVDKVRAPEVWSKYAIDGAGVVVGHLDTGIDASHPDLKGKVEKFNDLASNASGAIDGQGHGTHTAGSIAGGAASGKSIGVAPGARLIVGRIFNNSGSTTDAVILRGMNWIADPDGNAQTPDAPRLVSCSWGGDQETSTSGGELWQAAQRWMDLDILPVFAAGNSGPRERTIGTPGGFPHCFAVGATDSGDGIASFSSRGPIKWDGVDHIKPDVCAPGSRIVSSKDGGGYTTHSGTSMACPHAAGVGALVLQANPGLRPRQIVDILRSTAVRLGGSSPGNTFGWGRIDALKAVEKARALAAFERVGE